MQLIQVVEPEELKALLRRFEKILLAHVFSAILVLVIKTYPAYLLPIDKPFFINVFSKNDPAAILHQ